MRSHINAYAVANTVRMLRTQHKGAFLIVEGATDERVLRNVVEESACRIVIAHGQENALTATQILEVENFGGVLTILDADFRRIENDSIPARNIVLTDFHDLECMMMVSPAFQKLLSEFAEPVRLQSFESGTGSGLAETLVRNAMPLGYLRLISLREHLNLRFEELGFHKFVVRKVRRDVLERELRLAYEGAHFRQSNLARAILDWHGLNRPYRILRNL